MVLSFVLSNRKELVVERNTFSNPIGSMKCIGMEKHMSRTKRRKKWRRRGKKSIESATKNNLKHGLLKRWPTEETVRNYKQNGQDNFIS